MVDTPVLGAGAARHGGSSPLSRTKQRAGPKGRFSVLTICCEYAIIHYAMIYNRLATLRTMHGLSRQELADRVCVNYQTIGFIERGDYSPSLELALGIAKVFHVAVEEVFAATEFQPLIGKVNNEIKD